MPAPTVKAVLGQPDGGTTTAATTIFPGDSTSKINTVSNTSSSSSKPVNGGCGVDISSNFQQHDDHLELTPGVDVSAVGAVATTAAPATTTPVQTMATTDISVVSDHQDLKNEDDFLTGMYHPSLDVSPGTATATTTNRGALPPYQDEERFYDDNYEEEEEEEELVFGPSTESRNYSFNDGNDDDDDDDLRSIVSFSSLSVDTFFSFDDFHQQHAGGNNGQSSSMTSQSTPKSNRKPNGTQGHALPMISPGGESATTNNESNHSSTTYNGDESCSSFASSSSSSYTPSSLKARASVATGSATKLWNGLQIHMINKIPAIPNLLSHGSSSSPSSHDSTTVSPTSSSSSRSGEQVQTTAGTNGDEHQRNSSSNNGNNNNDDDDRSTTSMATNVVTETFQSWMNRRSASSSTAGGPASKLEEDTSYTTLQTTLQCDDDIVDDDDAFGLGDGLELPSASLHKVSNHDTELVVVDDGNNDDVSLTSPTIQNDMVDDDVQWQHRRRSHRQYGVTPKRQVTPPELPHRMEEQQQQNRQRPFAFLSFETVDSTNYWTFRSVSPMPSRGSITTTTTTAKDHSSSSEVDDTHDNNMCEDDTDIHAYNDVVQHTEDDDGLSIDSYECDDVLLHRDDISLDFDDSNSLGLDLFHPDDDDFDLDGLETESPDEVIHGRDDTQVMHDDDMDEDEPAEGKGCSYSSNRTDNDRQLHSGAGRHDKFSRLQMSQAFILRQCSVPSPGGNDANNDRVGSIHSSLSSEEEEDDGGGGDASSNFFPESDHTSVSSVETSHSEYIPEWGHGHRNNFASTKPCCGWRRRQQSPARSSHQGKNKKRKKQDTAATTKRIRKEEPKVKKYVEPTDQDVLLGRGGRSNHHPGNKVYRERVLELQAKYKTLSRDQKTAMSTSVVDWIQTKCGGNFLQFDAALGGNSQDGPWYVVLDKTARSKVSQALREDHTVEGRAAKLSRRRKNNKSQTKTTPRKKRENKNKTVQLGTPKSTP